MKYIIYGIKEKLSGEIIYVGSTCNLYNRIHSHLNCCYNSSNKQYTYKLYNYIRSIVERRDDFYTYFEFVSLKDCSDANKKTEEQFFIENLKPKCNCIRAFRTYEDELESSRKSHQRRRENNREQYNEYSRNHRKENLEAYRNWEKEYRASNLQKMRDKGNKWYAAHRDEYLAKRKAKRDAQKLSGTKI